MSSRTALLWVIVSGVVLTVAASAWMEHTGSCYVVHETTTSKDAAEVTCASLGGALTEIESLGEFVAVNDVLQGLKDDMWVGLQNNDNSGKFAWTTSGTNPEAGMWRHDEPNHSGTCVRLVKYFNDSVVADPGVYELADHLCSSLYRPFCEKPASPAISHSQKLSTLSESLCLVSSHVTSGKLECAQACAQLLTSCYVYSFHKPSGVCEFHRLTFTCAHSTAYQAGTVYYQITRACN